MDNPKVKEFETDERAGQERVREYGSRGKGMVYA